MTLIKEFDPSKFIDREFEQELFEELLEFRGTQRILAIEDRGGTGKSHLLEHFRYRCRTVQPRTPVSLIALDQLVDETPLTLIDTIIDHLSSFRIEFPLYIKHESARVSGDFSTILGSIYLQGATFEKAIDVRVSGVAVDRAEVVNVGSFSWSPDKDKVARKVIIQAFFDDLRECSTQIPIVIILDGFEKINPELQKWITDVLINNLFFDAENQCPLLLLVIAGKVIPKFSNYWSKDDCERIVSSINGLTMWTREHLEDCLKIHGFKYEEEDLNALYRLIERGLPPSEVIQTIQTLMVLG